MDRQLNNWLKEEIIVCLINEWMDRYLVEGKIVGCFMDDDIDGLMVGYLVERNSWMVD